MDHLAVEFCGEEGTFVDEDAGGAACAGLEEVRDDAGVLEVPVGGLDFLVGFGVAFGPACAGGFVAIAVVAEFHDEVDADPLVAVVVVIRLPDGTEGIDGGFPVVAEVPCDGFEVGAVRVAAEDHAFLVGFAGIADDIACGVGDGFAVFVFELMAFVAEVEVEFAVWAEVDGVDAVVVLSAVDAAEHDFGFVGFEVAVVVGEVPDFACGGDDDAVAEDGDAVWAFEFRAFEEDGGFVGFAVFIGVFEDEDAVAGGTFAVVAAVVDDFCDPDPAEVVDVDGRRAEEHGFGGEGFGFEAFGDVEGFEGVFGSETAAVVAAGAFGGAGFFCVDEELDGGAVALVDPAFIEGSFGGEAFGAGGEVEFDDGVGVGADAFGDGLAVDDHGGSAGVFVHVDVAPVGGRADGRHFGEFAGTEVAGDDWVDPVGPVAGEAVAAVGDDEEEFFGSGEVSGDVDGVADGFRGEAVAGVDRFGSGLGLRGGEDGEEDGGFLHERGW